MENTKVLVIGGGIAGIQASLDLADRGMKVHLVERESSIGGRMAQLDKTFPTNDCSICILAPKMADCFGHENIKVMTFSEVSGVEGEAGNYDVTVLRKARHVNEEKCTGCGTCVSVCPQNVFEMKDGKSHVARPEDCVECSSCVENCPTGAIKLVEPK